MTYIFRRIYAERGFPTDLAHTICHADVCYVLDCVITTSSTVASVVKILQKVHIEYFMNVKMI